MSVVSAVFLAGLALIAIPIWLHRLRAHSAEQRTFSSLFLMRRSEAPVNMQRRLQHLLLLAMRILLLVVLCLAFAEPLIDITASQTQSLSASHRILVIDNSLSMGAMADGGTALTQGKQLARDLLDPVRAGAGGKAAIVSVGQELELVTSLTDDITQLEAAIASIEQSAGRLAFEGLSGRLATVASTLVDPGDAVSLHLISDFQRSAVPDRFNALIDNATLATTLHAVGQARANWSIQAVHLREGPHPVVEVIVTGSDSGLVNVTLYRGDDEVASQALNVSAARPAIATFAVDLTGRQPRVWRAEIDSDDALAIDNTRYLARPRQALAALPIIATDRRAVTYLSAAVQAALPGFQLTSAESVVTDAPVIVVVDPGTANARLEAELKNYLQRGGAVLLTAGERTRAAGSFPLVDARLDATRIGLPSRGVVAVDRTHPVLTEFSGWQVIDVFQAVRFSEPQTGQTILALDDGSPLLIEQPVGAGRLLILATALDPQWSSLVVQPAFVSFVANAINYLAEEMLPSEAVVAQSIALPTQAVQIFAADGARVLGLGDTVERPAVRLTEPGIYEVRTPQRSQPLAVNADPREFDLVRADADLLADWQNATSGGLQSGSRREDNGGQENIEIATSAMSTRQFALAQWLLVLLLVAVCVECLAANLSPIRTREVTA